MKRGRVGEKEIVMRITITISYQLLLEMESCQSDVVVPIVVSSVRDGFVDNAKAKLSIPFA